jgi:uncharacterized protein
MDLIYAIKNDNLEFVESWDGDVNFKNGKALKLACIFGKVEMATILLSKGSIINDKCLDYACANGHLQIIELLIKYNSNINTKNNCLALAIHYKHFNIIYFLVNNGTHVNYDEALEMACTIKNEVIIKFLLDNGANRENINPEHFTNDIVRNILATYYPISKIKKVNRL